MKARIVAGGREIELEAGPGVTVAGLATEALALWRATEGATPPSTPEPFGFSLGMLPASELSQEATHG